MPPRKTFLTALSVAGVSAALARRVNAQPLAPSAAPATALPPAPRSAETASVSVLAAAAAEAMRRFDPHLSDAEVATIARGIEDDRKGAALLNPANDRLRNGAEPVTIFVVPAE